MEEHVQHVIVKWQIALNVPQMEVNVRNVRTDIIQMEHHVNYVIQFMQNVPDVHKQLRHVQHVLLDIMSQEEVVLNVQIQ